MYVHTRQSGKRTQAFGVVAAAAMTVGMGALFTSMNIYAEKMKQNSMELVMLPPPPPPPVIEEPKPPKVEVVEDTPAPPTPPPLVAPEIEFVPEEPPVITAPVADPIPIPEPVQVAPSPPVVSRSTPAARRRQTGLSFRFAPRRRVRHDPAQHLRQRLGPCHLGQRRRLQRLSAPRRCRAEVDPWRALHAGQDQRRGAGDVRLQHLLRVDAEGRLGRLIRSKQNRRPLGPAVSCS